MFDLLRPLTKVTMVLAFIAAFVAANAMLLYVLSSCISSSACIGTGFTADVLTNLRKWGGLFLPGNFYACIQFMFLGEVTRRAYDYAVKVMDTVAKTS